MDVKSINKLKVGNSTEALPRTIPPSRPPPNNQWVNRAWQRSSLPPRTCITAPPTVWPAALLKRTTWPCLRHSPYTPGELAFSHRDILAPKITRTRAAVIARSHGRLRLTLTATMPPSFIHSLCRCSSLEKPPTGSTIPLPMVLCCPARERPNASSRCTRICTMQKSPSLTCKTKPLTSEYNYMFIS